MPMFREWCCGNKEKRLCSDKALECWSYLIILFGHYVFCSYPSRTFIASLLFSENKQKLYGSLALHVCFTSRAKTGSTAWESFSDRLISASVAIRGVFSRSCSIKGT